MQELATEPQSLSGKVNQEETMEKLRRALERQNKRKFKKWLPVWSLISILTIWSVIGTGFTFWHLFYGITNMTAFLFQDLLPPNLSAVPRYIPAALDTLYMSYIGMILSVVISIFFGILGARNISPHPIIAYASRMITSFLRSVPALVWGILLVAAFGIGPFAGMLAIGLSGIGILGKAYAEGIEEIDQKQIEGIRAAGGNWFHILFQGVWPQFKTSFVAWSLYKLDLNIREAAVLGLVGAGGLGYSLQSSISLFQYKDASMIILMIFVLIMVVEFTTAKVRERIL